MSTILRALILFGTLIITVVSFFFLYRKEKKMGEKPNAAIIGFIIWFVLELGTFCICLGDILLSYQRLSIICMVSVVILGVTDIIVLLDICDSCKGKRNTKTKAKIIIRTVLIFCIALSILGTGITASEKAIVRTSDTARIKITPTVGSKETNISVKKDENGEIVSYRYLYFDENKELCEKELKPEDAKIQYIGENLDSCVIVTARTTTTINKEKSHLQNSTKPLKQTKPMSFL